MFSDDKEYRIYTQDGVFLADNLYNLVIGLTISSGIFINILLVLILNSRDFMIAPEGVAILSTVLIIFAYNIIKYSNKWYISYIGFLILSFSMGLILARIIPLYTETSVVMSSVVTLVVTLTMSFIAYYAPEVFLSKATCIGISLLIAVVLDTCILCIFGRSFFLFDIFITLAYSLIIGVDWANAQEYAPTLDNAIDSASDIYVDMVRLFIKILQASGKRKDRD